MLNKFLERLLNFSTGSLWIMTIILLVVYEILKKNFPIDAFIVLAFAYTFMITLFIKVIGVFVSNTICSRLDQHTNIEIERK